MKRYIFLLLAFFLSFSSQASYSVGSVSAAPNTVGSNHTVSKKASQRSLQELGNLQESTQQAQQPALKDNEVKKKTTALNSVSCKTYEGKIYDQGQAGYNDCIRTIKNDHQGTKSVP